MNCKECLFEKVKGNLNPFAGQRCKECKPDNSYFLRKIEPQTSSFKCNNCIERPMFNNENWATDNQCLFCFNADLYNPIEPGTPEIKILEKTCFNCEWYSSIVECLLKKKRINNKCEYWDLLFGEPI